ncbi:DUF3618 domain-containing protein [Microbispora cellulosiformans]|uniref:DUF3618 domain-containing protein n=1 Tax=Microbispora cellulosiformans TaxID=2614688 RepID=A0A5J5JUV2_9ACTN|nr:DUF3618 domain-containing protein [Microbispora cellulosiformans]KAA9374028.1 DUF3618 domain-containing protein [Microbispora cellulosiformans]
MADTDPDALEKRIERTRAELARTVDAIADRVSPKRVAERGVAKAKANAMDFVASVEDLVLGPPRGITTYGPEGAEAEPGEYPARDLAPVLIGVGIVVAVGATIVLLRRRSR